jgi:predicted DNA-binding transcriptional regulator AlpA
MHDDDLHDDDDLLDEAETCRYIGGTKPINPSTLWRGVRDGRYSKPIHIGPQSVRWIRGELRRDRERMIAARDAKTTEAA